MKVQIATRLALYAVLQLAAEPQRQFAAADIAERFGVSVNHLSKVLRTLGRAGLVEALRGAGGGYRFRGNPKRVTLLDVIQLFEEVGPADAFGDEQGTSAAEGLALRSVIDEIDDVARATLSSISITTMLKLVEEQRRGLEPAAPDRRSRAAQRRG